MSSAHYDPKFKLQVVLESLNPNTTIESVRNKYGLSKNAIASWRGKLLRFGHKAFDESDTKSVSESPEELKKIIADLTVENAILKKISNYKM